MDSTIIFEGAAAILAFFAIFTFFTSAIALESSRTPSNDFHGMPFLFTHPGVLTAISLGVAVGCFMYYYKWRTVQGGYAEALRRFESKVEHYGSPKERTIEVGHWRVHKHNHKSHVSKK